VGGLIPQELQELQGTVVLVLVDNMHQHQLDMEILLNNPQDLVEVALEVLLDLSQLQEATVVPES
jgi:hypothetical protein